MENTKHLGRCLCGAVRYEANQPPIFATLCHCHMCQQWTGSAMLGSAAFARDAICFTHGEPALYQASSVCDRGFCATCGSSLFTSYHSGGVFDNVYFVGLGTLDDPEIARPSMHYGAEGELSWMHRDDGLPRIRIDVDDPGDQNALFERMVAEAKAKL